MLHLRGTLAYSWFTFLESVCKLSPVLLSHRGRVSVTDGTSDGSSQPASRVKLTVTVYKDLVLHHYGFEICPNLPLTIASVTAGEHRFLLPTIAGVRNLNCPR